MSTTRSTGSVVMIVLGVLAALGGLVALGAGGGLLALDAVRADADGFVTSDDVALSTSTYALVSEDLDLWSGAGPNEWTPQVGDIGFRVSATAADGDVFVGVGPADDVAAYLDGVSHEVLTEIGTAGVTTRVEPGDGVPLPPAEVDAWDASAVGPGTQTLTWDATQGNWTVVVMAADGTAGLDVVASAGARVPWLAPIGIGFLVAAGLALVVAAVLLAAGAASTPVTTEQATAPAPAGRYPAALTASLDPGLSRWQWLVKWFLAIPHLVVLSFLWVAFAVLTVVAGVAILFTGRYPRGIFDFNVGVLRWSWRVTYYAYSVLGTDTYPPFTLARTDYPADFDVAYPEDGLSRGLVLVKWWLLAIPHYIIVAILTGGLVSWSADVGSPEGWQVVVGGGLTGVLTLVAVLALAFGGRYPRGLYDLLLGLQRWVFRVAAYVSLMTDEYPPFRLDPGGSEPSAGPTLPDGPPPPPVLASEPGSRPAGVA